MSERYGSYPPDEPVIGASPPPPPHRPSTGEPYIGGTSGAPASDDWDEEPYEEEEAGAPAYPVRGAPYRQGAYPEEEYEDDYDDSGYGDQGPGFYQDEPPARQPIFYLFILLAVLLGAAVIFLIYSLTKEGGGSGTPTTAAGDAKFKTAIDAPRNGDRFETGKSLDVQVSATSTEAIARFELFVGDQSVDVVAAVAPASGSIYRATLETSFDRRGDYTLFVRVTSSSGAHQDSDKIKVTAYEGVGDRPVSINGKVLAKVNLRTGPGEQFELVGTLDEGTQIKILGKTRDSEWLYVDVDGGRWVKRTAIQEEDSLALVPIREATPTPVPTATATPAPSPSASPSPGANAPDFVPVDAKFVFSGGGKVTLRLSIRNDAAPYNGPVVIGVTTSPTGLTSPQLVFDANLATGKVMTADFEVTGTLTDKADVTVKVDPANAIKEASEDNNTTTFKNVAAPADPPDLVILPVVFQGGTIVVTIKNNGGDLPSSKIRVVVSVGGADASQFQTVPLKKGESITFSIPKPGTGPGKVELSINDVPTASQDITVPP
jgi:uncharacterized protein YgiM (DUF1202 family)